MAQIAEDLLVVAANPAEFGARVQTLAAKETEREVKLSEMRELEGRLDASHKELEQKEAAFAGREAELAVRIDAAREKEAAIVAAELLLKAERQDLDNKAVALGQREREIARREEMFGNVVKGWTDQSRV